MLDMVSSACFRAVIRQLDRDLQRMKDATGRPPPGFPELRMFETTIAGSLPKPAWLAEPNMLWAPWKPAGDDLAAAKRDATLLAIKLQEDAGIDIVTDGEQSRQHFVHGFLENVEGIDFAQARRDGHPQRPLQGDGADGHRPAAPARSGACDRGSAGAGAHRDES